MNKKQFLASLSEVYCRIGVTKHGVGVVAIRTIPKGVNPFKNCDPHGGYLKIPKKELDTYPCDEAVKDMVRDFCALRSGVYFVPDYSIDALDKSFYLNHSKTPNLTARKDGEEFIAARDIPANEELTVDYDTFNEKGLYRGFKP